MGARYVRLTGDPDAPAVALEVEPLGDDRFRVTIGEDTYEVEGFLTDRGLHVRRDGRSVDARVELRGDTHRVQTPSGAFAFQLESERVYKMKSALGVGQGGFKPELPSPMTGKVVLVDVAVGDQVEEGQTLVVIEAMKMENEIKAAGDAVVKGVHVGAGDLVSPGDLLVSFEEE